MRFCRYAYVCVCVGAPISSVCTFSVLPEDIWALGGLYDSRLSPWRASYFIVSSRRRRHICFMWTCSHGCTERNDSDAHVCMNSPVLLCSLFPPQKFKNLCCFCCATKRVKRKESTGKKRKQAQTHFCLFSFPWIPIIFRYSQNNLAPTKYSTNHTLRLGYVRQSLICCQEKDVWDERYWVRMARSSFFWPLIPIF